MLEDRFQPDVVAVSKEIIFEGSLWTYGVLYSDTETKTLANAYQSAFGDDNNNKTRD